MKLFCPTPVSGQSIMCTTYLLLRQQNVIQILKISFTCLFMYIIVIVNKLSSNILSPARRFGKVTEYLIEAC